MVLAAPSVMNRTSFMQGMVPLVGGGGPRGPQRADALQGKATLASLNSERFQTLLRKESHEGVKG